MLVGYARVSTRDQNLASQVAALKAAGAEKIFEDYASGARRERPGLSAALDYIRPGDTLTVWKLDRLGRSLRDLLDLSAQLEARGIHLRSLTDMLDTSTSSGRLIFHVLASLAEMERDLIRERTKVGLDAARARGRTGGRPRKLTREKEEAAERLLASGLSVQQVANTLSVSRDTINRRVSYRKPPDDILR